MAREAELFADERQISSGMKSAVQAMQQAGVINGKDGRCFDAASLMQTGGWREIGGKRYYFFPDGAVALNTKIDAYEIGPNEVRKE